MSRKEMIQMFKLIMRALFLVMYLLESTSRGLSSSTRVLEQDCEKFLEGLDFDGNS